jgi:hypothetical protein
MPFFKQKELFKKIKNNTIELLLKPLTEALKIHR